MMKQLAHFFFPGLASLLWLTSTGNTQQTWEYEAPVDRSYLTARFRCWMPSGLKSPRAVLVLVPGQNVDGRKDVDDVRWQELAAREKLALLGVFFTGDAVRDYSQAERGSGLALVRALDEFSRRPEARDLALAKLFIQGISTGGQFAFSFAQYQPQRVAGFTSLDGIYFTTRPTAGGCRVPGLFAVRGPEKGDAVRKNLQLFSKNRERGALWVFVRYRDDIEESVINDFTGNYRAEVLKARLNPRSPLSGLENLSEIQGWDGNLETRELAAASQIHRGMESLYSWLVSEPLARAWAGVSEATKVKEVLSAAATGRGP